MKAELIFTTWCEIQLLASPGKLTPAKERAGIFVRGFVYSDIFYSISLVAIILNITTFGKRSLT